MKKITILVPCYNEEGSLPALYKALSHLMNQHSNYNWELLFVDDGSKDKTIQILKRLRQNDNRLSYLELSRNFGKENAMLAGFDYATGDCVIIMDADLQHPPQVIPEMLKKWESGFEDVYGKRLSRGKESYMRKKLSLLYYSLLQKSTRYDILPNVGDFRLLDRKCIDALKQLRESERYTKGLFCFIGFKKTYVEFETQDRIAGASSWNYLGLISLAIQGITSFTVAPLRLATLVGTLVSFLAFFYMIFSFIKALVWGDAVQGFPTLIIIILFLGGVELLCLGIIGEYVGRIFSETKRRPVYIVRNYNEE